VRAKRLAGAGDQGLEERILDASFTPPALRWALYEAAQSACRRTSPDREYYGETAKRLGHNRACAAVSRKLLKRACHTLRELGEEALAPA
jgi:transposase